MRHISIAIILAIAFVSAVNSQERRIDDPKKDVVGSRDVQERRETRLVLDKGTAFEREILSQGKIAFISTSDEFFDPRILGTKYAVGSEEVLVGELRFENVPDASEFLAKRVTSLKNCKFIRTLNYKDESVGQLFECSTDDRFVLTYSYGVKFYEISAGDRDAAETLTKKLLPVSCHLHGSSECIGMFY